MPKRVDGTMPTLYDQRGKPNALHATVQDVADGLQPAGDSFEHICTLRPVSEIAPC